MLLSIVINAYPGTDLFRFRLSLELYIYSAPSPKNYEKLTRDLLNGWDKGIFKIPDDKFESILTSYGFSTQKFNPDNLEVILAMDGSTSDSLKIIREFKDWCSTYSIHQTQIITSDEKRNLSTLRNVAMQTFTGEMLMFRDDDDFSAPFSLLLKQAEILKSEGFGCNDQNYWNKIPAYNHVSELETFFMKHQTKPVIAILVDGMKLKNTWGSKSNPFSQTPVPIDTSTLELVDRPPFSSMSSKIFSRESLKYIYNTACANSLEDARTHYLQVLPQHCIWLFEKERLEWLKKGWTEFKHDDTNKEGIEAVKWLNMNVMTYKHWQIPLSLKEFKRNKNKNRNRNENRNENIDKNINENKDKNENEDENINIDENTNEDEESSSNFSFASNTLINTLTNEREDRIHEEILYDNRKEDFSFQSSTFHRVDEFFLTRFQTSVCSPNFIYVFPSGSYSKISWTWGSVIGALEACRESQHSIDFTINDLKRLKYIITNGMKTTLINTNNVSKLEWTSSSSREDGKKLCEILTPLVNYRYMFWFAVVHKIEDWKFIEITLRNVKTLIWRICEDKNDKNKEIKTAQDHDIVNENPIHPNQEINVEVNGRDVQVSVCNCGIVKFDETNKTNKSNKSNKSNDGINLDDCRYTDRAEELLKMIKMIKTNETMRTKNINNDNNINKTSYGSDDENSKINPKLNSKINQMNITKKHSETFNLQGGDDKSDMNNKIKEIKEFSPSHGSEFESESDSERAMNEYMKDVKKGIIKRAGITIIILLTIAIVAIVIVCILYRNEKYDINYDKNENMDHISSEFI